MEIKINTTYFIYHETRGINFVFVTRATKDWIDGILVENDEINTTIKKGYEPGDTICMTRTRIVSMTPINEIFKKEATDDDKKGMLWWNSLDQHIRLSLFSNFRQSDLVELTPKFFWERHKLYERRDES